MTVDGMWSLIGSTNWDTRSLRLNFEFNCEAYDNKLTGQLDALVEQRIAKARQLKLHDLESLPWLEQLRNGIARLFSPYL
jgi:cardiolipin synthase